MIKTAAKTLLALVVMLAVVAGGFVLLADSPMKTMESFAIRHADKLPLARIGHYLFDEHCANCHDNPAMHAPTRESLAGFSKDSLLIAMEFGKMQPMAAHLTKQERGLIAIYLAGNDSGVYDWVDNNLCESPLKAGGTEYVTNWGLGNQNRRFVPNATAGITPDNVSQLQLAWALAFPRVTDMRSQPAIIGNTLYLGDKAGMLYAIDRTRGCIFKHTKVFSGIRSAITVATLTDNQTLLIFADSVATVFAVDPQSLDIVWQRPARLFDTSVVTGSITYHDNTLFVPVSSYEVAASGAPTHECCHSHGGVIALDATNGSPLWEWHATPAATRQGTNADGKAMYGPSGAAVWTTPAVDPARNRIYFGTGENLSHPATDTSDAIIALDMDTGELAWRFQAITGDVWNAACLNGGANCPENPGGDFDFGASVIIARDHDDRDILLAGQKSGEVFALDPETTSPDGTVLWRERVSLGTTNGGIHWGMALSGNTLVIPVADPERDREGYTPAPGLYALDASTGKRLWETPVERGCEIPPENRPLIGLESMRAKRQPTLEQLYACSFYYGLSAAATATDELAFSAGLNGIIRAYDIHTGNILWRAQTAKPFAANNGVEAHGGAIDVGGQVIANGWLYVQSGYSMFGQLPGNVLLAYRVPE